MKLTPEIAEAVRRMSGTYPVEVRAERFGEVHALEVRVASIPVMQVELRDDDEIVVYALCKPTDVTPKAFRHIVDFVIAQMGDELEMKP
jgi:hypothetical protein